MRPSVIVNAQCCLQSVRINIDLGAEQALNTFILGQEIDKCNAYMKFGRNMGTNDLVLVSPKHLLAGSYSWKRLKSAQFSILMRTFYGRTASKS